MRTTIGSPGARSHGKDVPLGSRIACIHRDKGHMEKEPRQRIRYLRTGDGVQVAWAESGDGPLLVKAANWLCHLEFEWESPVWSHWIRFFSNHFRFVRYDERGCGMTGGDVDELSVERWIDDLETVVDAAEPHEPFALLGVSHGSAACIGYA